MPTASGLAPSPPRSRRQQYLAMVGGGAFCSICSCTTTRPICARCCTTTAATWSYRRSELYTEGLLTDSTMLEAFLAREGEP